LTDGRDVIVVRVIDVADGRGDLDRALDLLRDLAIGQPILDRPGPSFQIVVADGLASLSEVARRLEAAGLPLAEVCLRRPTADDARSGATGAPGRPIRRSRPRPGGTPA
jgi:hypothetical protein